MRKLTTIQLIAVAALAAVPAIASAAPLRAGASLPTTSTATLVSVERAATPVEAESDLLGFPIFAVIGLFVAVGLIAVVASTGGRSPG